MSTILCVDDFTCTLADPSRASRIAMTLDTVRPAHGAATVGIVRDEANGSQPIQDLWGAALIAVEIYRQLLI